MKYENVIRKMSEAVVRRAKPIDMASFQNVSALTRNFGFDRGQPVDRYYIACFLKENRDAIKGDILEVAERLYATKYGTEESKKWQLNYSGDGSTTDEKQFLVAGDLTRIDSLPTTAFDCFICTQTLNCIFELNKAVQTIRNLLKPGGIALITLPCITQLSGYDVERWGDFWRFTPASGKRLFSEVFCQPGDDVSVSFFGNLIAATTLLRGAAVEDLPNPSALHDCDPDYPVITCLRVKKAESSQLS